MTGTCLCSEPIDLVVAGGDTSYFLVDVRAAEHFDDHIDGVASEEDVASIPYGTWNDKTILETIPDDKTIITVCYTGHTASQTATVLNMLGYEAYAMAYSMMGWHSDPDIVGKATLDCAAVTTAALPVVTN